MLARRILAAARITSLDPDAQILIAAMTTAPGAARRTLISDHIIALKAAGIWSQLDTYYMMAAHHEQASRLNWKSPGNFTLTANGDITFTVDRGWQGDGATGYLDTGWIPTTHGVNYTLNDASLGVYSRTNIDLVGVDMGARNSVTTGRSFLRMLGDGEVQRIEVNRDGSTATANAIPNSLGLGAARRNNSANQQSLRNGTVLGSFAESSNTLTARSFFIGALNTDGTAQLWTIRQYSAAFTAAAMSEAQHAALYDAMQTGYLAAVGAAV